MWIYIIQLRLSVIMTLNLPKWFYVAMYIALLVNLLQFFLSRSVENVVNTRLCMKKINTVIYRETGIIFKNTVL